MVVLEVFGAAVFVALAVVTTAMLMAGALGMLGVVKVVRCPRCAELRLELTARGAKMCFSCRHEMVLHPIHTVFHPIDAVQHAHWHGSRVRGSEQPD
jgi:hypothetical protein